MRKILSIIFSVVVWFAVVAQFILMLQNREVDVPEVLIRFFSYFTILTNALVAFYFTAVSFDVSFTNKPGILTAITTYIFMVGIVYQVALRHLWQPTGMQFVVDELLHTVNPLLVIIYWYLYEKKRAARYGQVKLWLIYPLGYLAFVLIGGSFSGFYPYPFINVSKIGLTQACVNSVILTLIFIIVGCLFILVGKKIGKTEIQATL
jgi:hypothetical protein